MAVTFPITISIPASVTAGGASDCSEVSPFAVYIDGTFTATYQVQISPQDSGSIWSNTGSPLTAAGNVVVTAPARRVRINCTAYTSGTPTAYAVGLYKTSGQ